MYVCCTRRWDLNISPKELFFFAVLPTTETFRRCRGEKFRTPHCKFSRSAALQPLSGDQLLNCTLVWTTSFDNPQLQRCRVIHTHLSYHRFILASQPSQLQFWEIVLLITKYIQRGVSNPVGAELVSHSLLSMRHPLNQCHLGLRL